MPEAGDVTRLLKEADEGKPEAASQLFKLVEEDLCKIARQRKRKKGLGTDDDPSTMHLVDEAFLRIVGKDVTVWQPGDRRKFFGYVGEKIHDLIVDLLREEQALKRGGGWRRVDFGEGTAECAPARGGDLDLLIDLKAALQRYQVFAREAAILFRIRVFLDCTFEETAAIMGIPKTETYNTYKRTQLWLQRELKDYDLGREWERHDDDA